MKKFLILLILPLGIALSACGSNQPGARPIETVSQESPSLVGTWSSPDNPDFQMSAHITAKDVTIFWLSEDTKSLYWKGTFPMPTKVDDGTTIVSKADVDALSSSMLGSQDKTKAFKYSDDSLSFEFSIMGTTKTIHLER